MLRKLIPFGVLFLVFGCSANVKNNLIQVEFDVFSGRPNPSWELSQQEADQIMGYLGKIELTQDTMNLVGGLGYRGFVLTIKKADASILGANRIRIYRQFVAPEGDNSKVYRDSNGLDSLLLRQASLRGYEDIVKAIK